MQARDEIRANMEAKGINATGRTADSIRVEPFEGGVRLIGGYNTTHPVADYPRIRGTAEAADTAPIPTLEFGRGASKGIPPAPRGFYYILREWSRAKGLNFSSERERSTFAYFLGRKIIAQGTERSRRNVDIYSTPVANARDRINAILGQTIAKTVRAALGRASVTSLQGAFS